MYGETRVYKKIKVIGVAPGSVENAIQAAINKARETIEGVDWFEVRTVHGHVGDDGSVVEYQVTLEVSFQVK